MSSTMTIVVAVVVVLAVIAFAVLLGLRVYRSRHLRARFGPEYQRAVEETGDRRAAERQLHEREQRREQLPIRELGPTARQGYAMEWRAVQSRFVDDPASAVGAADELVTRLMRERGYPTESFEQQVADVSVDYAGAAESYRRARAILQRARGQVATDDLRQAMVHYRELFEELLGEPAGTTAADRPSRERRAGDGAPSSHREVT
ncbi:MAG TPA: hypothetical protein VGO86_19110 [Candidatus Dormibacteraeota bacterium]